MSEIRPPFYWTGSKGRMADWIVSLLRPSNGYLEPFAGSAAVLLARKRVPHETINDLDRGVVAFFRTLRDRPEELHRVVSLTPYAEAEFDSCLEQDPDESMDDLERARRFFVRTMQGFQADARYPSWAMTVDADGPRITRATSWDQRIKQFDRISSRLRGVQVASRDAVKLLERHVDVEDISVYCDPPYHNDDVSVRYLHHEESLHDELAEVLHRMRGHVLISGYPGGYDELYSTWQRIERDVAATGGTYGGHSIRRTEVIWSNKPTWPGIHEDS